MSFKCQGCKPAIQKLRRCQEDREDFTIKDGNLWPMYVDAGGSPFGFCPGKATWDHSSAAIFKILIISAETGAMYESGGLSDQPEWFVEMLAWFLPRYNDLRFNSRVKSVMGEAEPKKAGRK